MFKKPKINRQNKFLGMSSEIDSEKPSNNNLDENSNITESENIKLNLKKAETETHNQQTNSFGNIENSEDRSINSNINERESSDDGKNKIINNPNSNHDNKLQELSEQKEAIKMMLSKNINNTNGETNKVQQNLPLNEDANYSLNQPDNNIQNESLDYSDQIKRIKAEIDKKSQKVKRRGILIKPLEKVLTTFNKSEENSDPGIKKIFISENDLKNTKNPEELKKLMGINKQEIDKEKKSKLQKILDHQKDLFTLPDDLRVTPETKNDYVDNLIKLSAAGLIEVPLSLENKLKNIEETEIMKKQIIDKRLVEELDYLKVLKKLGPSYAKGYKNDLSRKKLTKLNNVFENVFVNLNGRKRKLLKEKMILDNRMIEEGYIRKKEDVRSEKNSNSEELDENEDKSLQNDIQQIDH